MKFKVLTLVTMCCVLTLVGPMAWSNGKPQGDIAISPQTLILSQDQCAVTVHTSIPFSGQGDVMLENIAARAVFADNRGDLVARFSEPAVKQIVAPPRTTLRLYVDGELIGADTVRVID